MLTLHLLQCKHQEDCSCCHSTKTGSKHVNIVQLFTHAKHLVAPAAGYVSASNTKDLHTALQAGGAGMGWAQPFWNLGFGC